MSHQLFQDTALRYEFFYYFYGVIELMRVNQTSLVKWLYFFNVTIWLSPSTLRRYVT